MSWTNGAIEVRAGATPNGAILCMLLCAGASTEFLNFTDVSDFGLYMWPIVSNSVLRLYPLLP